MKCLVSKFFFQNNMHDPVEQCDICSRLMLHPYGRKPDKVDLSRIGNNDFGAFS